MRRVTAEAVGSFLVVLAVGGAVFLGKPGANATHVALVAGVVVAGATFWLGPVSGALLNPAVTVAAAIAGRLGARSMAACFAAQLAGANAAMAALTVIAHQRAGATPEAPAMLANGWGALSPGWYAMEVALAVELALTGVLVLAWLSVTSGAPGTPQAPLGWGGRALRLGALHVLLHLVAVPVTGAALNPARALAAAAFVGGAALDQVWLFVAAPLAGAGLAGLAHRVLRAGAPLQLPPATRASDAASQ